MTPFNFAPLYRSTIGFDRLAHLVDSLATTGEDGGYPPYNIERVAENSYRISMAVAGFTRADVNIEVKDTTLSVRGEKKLSDVGQPEYLHRGIAQRGFAAANVQMAKRFGPQAFHRNAMGWQDNMRLVATEAAHDLLRPDPRHPITCIKVDGASKG